VYSQILICASFVAASYQDFKERSVSDIVWIPAIVGAGYVVVALYPNIQVLLPKLAIVGVIGLVFYFFGKLGQADPIAFAFLVWDPVPFSLVPIMMGTGAVMLAHIGYEYLAGNLGGARVIPIDQFLREQCWIPRAVINNGVRKEVDAGVNVARDLVEKDVSPGSVVEVEYGLPDVTYFGMGYIIYVAYLVLFNLTTFLSIP